MSSVPVGYIDPSFPRPAGPNEARIIIYGYTPAFALCVVAIVLFVLAAAIHGYQVIRYKTYYFIPLTVACLMEVVGYVARTLSSKKSPYNIIYFIIQYFFIVTAPVFISASIYLILSKLIGWSRTQGYSSPSLWLRSKFILWTFITCDVFSTVLQIVGAALIGKAESNRQDPTTANNILLAGLAFQSFAFLVFLILLTIYTLSLVRDERFGARLGGKRTFFMALFVASIAVFLRTLFRLAETAQGLYGELSTHEAYFAGLEFVPVIVAVFVLAVWHPGRWLPIHGREIMAEKNAVVHSGKK